MTRSPRHVKPTVQHTFDPGAFRDIGGRESTAGSRRLHPATATTATTSQGLPSGSPSLLRCLVIIAYRSYTAASGRGNREQTVTMPCMPTETNVSLMTGRLLIVIRMELTRGRVDHVGHALRARRDRRGPGSSVRSRSPQCTEPDRGCRMILAAQIGTLFAYIGGTVFVAAGLYRSMRRRRLDSLTAGVYLGYLVFLVGGALRLVDVRTVPAVHATDAVLVAVQHDLGRPARRRTAGIYRVLRAPNSRRRRTGSHFGREVGMAPAVRAAGVRFD